MSTPDYDVIIVGAGVAGSILAAKLGTAGVKVLVLESGPGPLGRNERETYLVNFKKVGLPYPINKWAPKEQDFFTNKYSYYVPPDKLSTRPQQGPVPGDNQLAGDPFASTNIINTAIADGDWYQSNYERQGGGSGWHWLGTSLRLLPNDFRLASTYAPQLNGRTARDWPISYSSLEPYYAQAENEIGVSGNKEDQEYLGLTRSTDYPMSRIPPSYLDQRFTAALEGQTFNDPYINQDLPLQVMSTPQARNSTFYKGRPQCGGGSSCIPICPIQAKYDPTQHIQTAMDSGKVEYRFNSVVTRVTPDNNYGTPHIVGVDYKTWDNIGHSATARIYVLAAHAVENAKILLNSPFGRITVANSSGQVGQNLADHPVSLVYGITDEPVYGYRGPLSTSGIESLRDGAFRQYRGAFRMEIGNDGWTWPNNDPYTTPQDFLNTGLYGKDLADAVARRLVRQTRIGCLTEQLPNQDFCVQLSDKMDALGIPRPKLTYGIDEYGQRALSAAVAASIQVFRRLIANPIIEYNYNDWSNGGAVTRDEGRSDPKAKGPANIFVREGWAGAGHLMGTHRMGFSASDSVVDHVQRTWDHPNLFLLGSGSWPSYATGNPTLTIAAVALRTGDAILAQLRGGTTPAQPTITSVVPGPGRVTINVDTPDTGGGPIVRFDMMATSGNHAPGQWLADPPIQWEGLEGGETYTIAVTATNAAGRTSQPSAPSAPVTPLGALPTAPTAISLVPDDTGNGLILKFSAPSYVGVGPIQSYKVYVKQGILQNEYPAESGATEARFPTDTLGDLAGVPVYAQVSAVTGAGEGPRSEALKYPP
jgi:choline dehydrogenase-like flavoprotein